MDGSLNGAGVQSLQWKAPSSALQLVQKCTEQNSLHFATARGRKELRQEPPPSGTELIFSHPKAVELDGAPHSSRAFWSMLRSRPMLASYTQHHRMQVTAW